MAIISRSEYRISNCDGALLVALAVAPTSTRSPSLSRKSCCVITVPLTLTQPVCNRCLILLRAQPCSCTPRNNISPEASFTCNLSDIILALGISAFGNGRTIPSKIAYARFAISNSSHKPKFDRSSTPCVQFVGAPLAAPRSLIRRVRSHFDFQRNRTITEIQPPVGLVAIPNAVHFPLTFFIWNG